MVKPTDILIDNNYISPKKITFLNFFGIGFIVYTLGYILKINPLFNNKIIDLLRLFGLVISISSAIFLIKFRIKNNYLKFLLILYCLWFLYILRGIQFNYEFIMYMLLNPDYGMLLYFVPLILLIPQNLFFYKKLFRLIVVFGIIFIICNLFFVRELLDRSFETQDVIELLARSLAMPAGFLILTYKYHSKKNVILALIVMILSVLFSIYKARRGLSTTLISILFFSYLGYIFSSKQKILIGYLSVLFICLGAVYATSIYRIENNKLLNRIAERGDEDTRTGVELYFYDDMKMKDWIIGKGLNGQYYCPNISEDQESDYRSYIETGYLQIILKGGLVRLILILLITVPAIILGLFFSKNNLAKASAIWIIIALISLYPATVESFSLQYFLVWISVGICYSKEMRKIPDSELILYFNQTH